MGSNKEATVGWQLSKEKKEEIRKKVGELINEMRGFGSGDLVRLEKKNDGTILEDGIGNRTVDDAAQRIMDSLKSRTAGDSFDEKMFFVMELVTRMIMLRKFNILAHDLRTAFISKIAEDPEIGEAFMSRQNEWERLLL